MKNVVEIINLEKKFDDNPVLKGLSLSIPEGDMTAIVGPSGSGKSTLLNIMGLLESPTKGEVILFGEKNVKNNGKKTMNFLRYKIGYLFQNYALIDNETVEQNLEIALKYSSKTDKKKEIDGALTNVGLKGFEKRKIYSLSGGEQQRVAMARVLLKPCDLVLADEPTGNLDDDNKEAIMNILIEMKDMGKTVIVVTHDTRILENFDQVVSL